MCLFAVRRLLVLAMVSLCGLATPGVSAIDNVASPGPQRTDPMPAAALHFPQDHDAHQQAGAEVWNLFLLLQTRAGTWLPVRHQWTRLSVRQPLDVAAATHSPWAYESVFRHWYSLPELETGDRDGANAAVAGEQLARGALELAGIDRRAEDWQRLHVHGNSLSWRAASAHCQLELVLDVTLAGYQASLSLTSRQCPVTATAFGPSAGLADAGIAGFGQRFDQISGTLTAADDTTLEITGGLAWLERGWGSFEQIAGLTQRPVVIERWLLQLADSGTPSGVTPPQLLLVQRLRRRDGSGRPQHTALSLQSGNVRFFDDDAVDLVSRKFRTSRGSGNRYASAWSLTIADLDIAIEFAASRADQESQSALQPGWYGSVESSDANQTATGAALGQALPRVIGFAELAAWPEP